MGHYEFDDEIIELDRELERAVIRRFLEKRYLVTLTLGSFITGFLLGILAYAL